MSMPRCFNSAVLFLIFAAYGSRAAQAQSCPDTPKVHTPVGTICGTIVQAGPKQIASYRGIPYAQPPVGQNRWKAPQAMNALPQSPFQATQLACICPQTAPRNTSPPIVLSRCSNPAQSSPLTQAEDCLNLTVWTPASTTPSSNLPVMVFIHGGAFDVGSGESPAYDGTSLAAMGNLVVVTFNYRLGALGYLPMNDDSNFGLQDQYQALDWVKSNISSFGGNPQNITVFGESAGAMSVALLTLSLTKPVPYQAAILESNPAGLPYKEMTDALDLKKAFMGDTGCDTDQCLMGLPASKIVAKETALTLDISSLTGLGNVLTWAPVIDGTLLSKEQPLVAAQNGKLTIPLILGTNQSEGNLFAWLILQESKLNVIDPSTYSSILDILFKDHATDIKKTYRCPAPTTDCTAQLEAVITDYTFTCANLKLALYAKNSSTYVYQFTQNDYNVWGGSPTVPQCTGQACHGDEIPFVFNNPVAGQFSSGDQILSALMQRYWTNFSTIHDPNSTPFFKWPAFGSSSNYIFLNALPKNGSPPLDTTANCSALWDTIGYEKKFTWSQLAQALKIRRRTAH